MNDVIMKIISWVNLNSKTKRMSREYMLDRFEIESLCSDYA